MKHGSIIIVIAEIYPLYFEIHVLASQIGHIFGQNAGKSDVIDND